MDQTNESAEDYLERILMLRQKNGFVRSKDLVDDMNFSKPSISIAMKKLRDKNLVVMNEETGELTLTEEGEKIASRIYERHKVISSLLMKIGVDEKTAIQDACKIEHDLSDESFQAIKTHLNNLEK